MLPFTPEQLEAAVEEGLVTKRPHPSLPLFIYNYSPDVQYRNYWNDVTLNCRGLILDAEYNIIARPWKKFFNLGQVELPIQFDDPVEVMDKADGSLGILYPQVHPEGYDVVWAIATRGSFTSEQAIHASEVWRVDYSHLMPLPDYTILFEIIYPENRIVLDYGKFDGLMLLGAVQNSTGYYLGPNEAKYMFTHRETKQPTQWPDLTVNVMPYRSISEALGHTDRPNAEGYVIRSHNFMVKVKQPDYLELHRLVTNASPKTVWEQLRAGKNKDEIVSAFPDEFHDYVGGMIDPLIYSYGVRVEEIMDGFYRARGEVEKDGAEATRKDYARVFSKSKDAKYYFLMLDGRPIREVLWTELKPKSE